VNAVTAPFDVANISQAYNDLIIVLIGRGDGAAIDDQFSQLRFNNDTAGNYDTVYLLNTGGSQNTGATSMFAGYTTGPSAAAATFGVSEIRVFGYGNTTRRKTALILGGEGATTQAIFHSVGTWKSTAAITRVQIFPATGTGFVAGSELRIYGRL
jgi:hypothetical protein